MIELYLATADALAAAVRGRRAELRLSQAEVSRAAGVPRASISQIENAQPYYRIEDIHKILEALGVRPLALPTPPIRHTPITREEYRAQFGGDG